MLQHEIQGEVYEIFNMKFSTWNSRRGLWNFVVYVDMYSLTFIPLDIHCQLTFGDCFFGNWCRPSSNDRFLTTQRSQFPVTAFIWSSTNFRQSLLPIFDYHFLILPRIFDDHFFSWCLSTNFYWPFSSDYCGPTFITIFRQPSPAN